MASSLKTQSTPTMIMKSVSHYSPLLIDPNNLHCSKSSQNSSSKVCCSLRNYASIPKRHTFDVSKFHRILPDPPIIQRVENQLSDYCTGLEGDECCSCWEAYLELKELEREIPEKEIENLITDTNGMRPLVKLIHGASRVYKSTKNKSSTGTSVKKHEEAAREREEERCPIPDGIPKSAEEIEEEERWKMPETAETRMLRAIRGYPSWYIARPDHETD